VESLGSTREPCRRQNKIHANEDYQGPTLKEILNPPVVGKSITTNPGYFSSGRFLNGEGVKRLLFSQLGSLVKG
jgi:hypothetical protein